MAAVETTSIPLGFKAPDFNLLDTVSGEMRSLDDLKSDIATVVMFICNHCPYVIHINDQLVSLANDYIPKGIKFIAISSNDIVNYPADSPDKMHNTAIENGYPFPYLYDESQDIAKAYHAACTPDFSIFDKNLQCTYRGQLDGSRPNSGIESDGIDIRKALDDMLTGSEVNPIQIPSLGCSIKWKK